ncbi:MAG: PAS domain-containing protein, partial [Nitrospinota bacterium]|nr:PAS domain-containing protein [Nitrospinota bacterium]
RDITDRKLYEMEVTSRDQEKTSLLNGILRSSMDLAIVVADPGFRITRFNPMAEEIYGYKAEDVLGKTVMQIHTLEKVDESRYQAGLKEVYLKGEHRFSFRKMKEDGPHQFEGMLSRINGDDGALAGFLLTCREAAKK